VLLYPSLTPKIILLIKVRVVPCTVLSSLESDGLTTSNVLSSCLYVILSSIVLDNSPLGPLTVTVLPSILTVTSLGMSIIFLPTRLMLSHLLVIYYYQT